MFVALQAQHRPPGQVRIPSLELIPCRRRLRLKVEDGNSRDDRKDTAVTAKDAVRNFFALAPMEQ
jgi:hypothetical protein